MLEVQQGDDENVHLNEALIKHGHEQATSQLRRENCNWQQVRRQRRRGNEQQERGRHGCSAWFLVGNYG